MSAPPYRRAGVWGAPRISAVLGTILFGGTCLTACSVTPASDAPTGTPLAEPSIALPSPNGTNAPFLVPVFDGPAPQPVSDGTTHVVRNENPGGSDFRTVEYTIPPGWEIGDVYIGKNLGQSGEVAISFWTPAGVYSDPCRRTPALNPIDLADHTHADGGELILMSYPQIGLSAQDGRAATEPRSVIVNDPSEDDGTIALRLELTVPADLNLASCDDGVYVAWPGTHAGDRPNDNHLAGQTDIIYQVDVDRGPLVIDASFRPESPPEDVEELYAVLGLRRVGCGCTLHLWMNCPSALDVDRESLQLREPASGLEGEEVHDEPARPARLARCDTPRTQSALFRARGSLARPELWSAPNAFALASTRERASWFPWWWHCGCRSFTPPVRPADGRPLDPPRRRPRTE